MKKLLSVFRDPFSQNFVFRPIEPQPQGMLEIEVRNWVLQTQLQQASKKTSKDWEHPILPVSQ